MAKRISHKNIGEVFTLRFSVNGKTEKYQLTSFHGIHLESSVATFSPMSLTPGVYGTTIQLTRHKGRWVHGPAAQLVQSVDY